MLSSLTKRLSRNAERRGLSGQETSIHFFEVFPFLAAFLAVFVPAFFAAFLAMIRSPLKRENGEKKTYRQLFIAFSNQPLALLRSPTGGRAGKTSAPDFMPNPVRAELKNQSSLSPPSFLGALLVPLGGARGELLPVPYPS